MPDETEHEAKYRENRELLNGPPPLSTVSRSWAATVAFYAAVHLVEQLAARDGVHHTRHTGMASRARYLATHSIHHLIGPDLSALLAASIVARYETIAAFAAGYPGDVVQTRLIDTHLAAIEAHATAHLSPPAPGP